MGLILGFGKFLMKEEIMYSGAKKDKRERVIRRIAIEIEERDRKKSGICRQTVHKGLCSGLNKEIAEKNYVELALFVMHLLEKYKDEICK